jgi:DNA polymerase-3 subunit delta'
MDWKILGHEWAVELLSQQIARERVRHAYLFSGPHGVGRQLLAVRLAQALNCTNPPDPGQPCFSCSTCTRLEKTQHPDLIVVQPEEESKVLKVEQVREVQHSLALAPYEARYKIALFLDFQRAGASVPNAMLKTLEEPPPRVILMLTADDSDNLLPTITSRCEVLRLRSLPVERVTQSLQIRSGISAEQASLLAHISGGLPSAAIELNAMPEMLERRNHWLEDFYSLLGASRAEKFAFAVRMAKQAREDKTIVPLEMRTWISLWRDVLQSAANSAVPLVNPDWSEQVKELAAQTDFAQASKTLISLNLTFNRLEQSNINLQLAMEALLLVLPHIRLRS